MKFKHIFNYMIATIILAAEVVLIGYVLYKVIGK